MREAKTGAGNKLATRALGPVDAVKPLRSDVRVHGNGRATREAEETKNSRVFIRSVKS